jgi:hypothetical protein
VDSARILENLRRAAETTRGFPTDAPATAFLFELPR